MTQVAESDYRDGYRDGQRVGFDEGLRAGRVGARARFADFLLGMLGGLILSTAIEYQFGPIVTPGNGPEEPPDGYYEFQGEWYPEPTLAD